MVEFRYLPVETHRAALHMALDEACMAAVRRGDAPPTIRLYRWRPPSISIGNFQCLADEVDVAACAADEIPIVRRETGGGAVYHDAEVTYSIIGPLELFPRDVTESYRAIIGALVAALRTLDIAAEFRPVNDVVVAGRKISGSAQTRAGGVLLQHGTILLDVDAQRMFRYLTPDKSKLSDKPFIKSVRASVTSVSEHADAPQAVVEAALVRAFLERFPGVPGSWTRGELAEAEELARVKYAGAAWTHLR